MTLYLDALLAAWDTRRLMSIARQMARPSDEGGATVDANALIDAILGDRDAGSPSANWSARVRIKSWLIATTATMPEMRYIEGDA